MMAIDAPRETRKRQILHDRRRAEADREVIDLEDYRLVVWHE
jgi:hypothetical protein